MRTGRDGETFSGAEPMDGAVRSLRDVIVRWNGDNEWTAISRQGAVPGETLILDIDEGGVPRQLAVCVIESRRLFVDGDARHWIRLQLVDSSPLLFELLTQLMIARQTTPVM